MVQSDSEREFEFHFWVLAILGIEEEEERIIMAGKRSSPFSSPLLRPPPELLNVKEEGDTETSCWRKEVDENLKRLQSLLFGADQFLEKSDFSSAQILGLRLLGFLDSRSVTDADRDFIGPIRREVASKVDLALEGLVSDSDRYLRLTPFYPV